jgi:hypothetical protein
MKEKQSPEQKWPAVEEAYAFVLPSYQWAITRLESVDSRIQTLQAFILTVSTAVPAFVTTTLGKASLSSRWLVSALVIAGAAVLIGLVGRATGGIRVASPESLYTGKWLKKAVWEFKKDILYFAGKDFEANRKLVNWKGNLVTAMTWLFVVEVVLILMWILSAQRWALA